MNREELIFSLRAALTAGDSTVFPLIVAQHHAADLAPVLQRLTAGDVRQQLASLAPDPRAELFGYLVPEQQPLVAAAMERRELAELLERMSADDRADLFNRLPDDAREAVLPALAQAEREDIKRLAAYPEGSVGALMTSDYALLAPELTARDAVERLRVEAPDKETIYEAYVVDEQRRLVGSVSLRDLIVAPASARVDSLMKREVITVRADDPAREAAAAIERYDLLAVPVINGGDALVGIVTVDDAIDVVEEEATEDFHKGGGTLAFKGINMLTASPWLLYRKRVFWLVLLVFGNIFSGAGIAYFEDTIAAYIALVFFLPLLIDSGGNAGAQAATLMVRALATGDVKLRDWGAMLGREFGVAVGLALTMAAAVYGLGLYRGGADIAMVVSLSMILIVIVGSIIGMSLPFALSRFRLDPASASAPLITSIADGVGVLIYFAIAVAYLGAPAETAAVAMQALP